MKNKKDFNNQFATLRLREDVDENSVTGGGEAYLPGLDVPEKKYKGPKESDVHDGYKKVKGFRAGHTKDTGGFLYKDLWNVNEDQFKETIMSADKDRVYKLLDLVKDKDFKLYSRFLNWISDIYPHGYDEFRMAAGGLAEEENLTTDQPKLEVGDEAKVTKPLGPNAGKVGEVVQADGLFYTLQFKNGETSRFHIGDLEPRKEKGPIGPQMILSLDETEEVPYTDFNQYRSTLKSAYQDLWRYKDPNASIVGDAYDSIDSKDPSAVTKLDAAKDAITTSKLMRQSNKEYFLNAIEKIKQYLNQSHAIKESYSRFKKETVTRSKAQQMHEAVKLVEKKIKEASRILEYTSQLKTELFEDEETKKYSHHTKKVMERISNRIAETYVKLKKLK